jgi:NAD(P)-dependent dehydrogenase (short-subunit alcohol dehydrogenase family)
LRDRIGDIRARGAELVIVGNGAEHFARAFREDFELDCPVLVDPELRSYRAAGLRRGRVEVLSPRLAGNALRALRGGFRQTGVEGDPWQLGGVFVVRPDGALTYRYASREAGDHPPPEDILAALADDAEPLHETAERSRVREWLGEGLSALVDPGIVLSFDRTGFRIHSLAFDPADLDVDLGGRRMLVTGANSGIGLESALGLADLGAEVLLLCRNAERGEAAAEHVRATTGNRSAAFLPLDVASFASIRKLASQLEDRPVHALVHNAGVLPAEREESEDGLETTFATHVAGPHLLTHLLRPALQAAGNARVVWVSSGGMYTRRLQLDDWNWEERDYDGVVAYAETKRAQVVLAELWAEVLRGSGVVVNAMHPGWADTPSVRTSIPRFYRLARTILRSPAEGADTVVWLAASESGGEATGRFFFDRKPRRTHYLPFTGESPEDRGALWRLCESVTGATPTD